jgi:uncharacterized protein YgbK (DUF1537 family)
MMSAAAAALCIGAIADDLTGATDLALTLSRGGMRVKQVVGVPSDRSLLHGADAVVVALKSRTIPVGDAVAQSTRAAQALLDAGAQQLFFKYCSTFDSTDEGNIGPAIEALLALLGETRTLACPAFPTNKRTVYKGHLFVDDQLLSDSSMRDHPLTPMRDANLVRVLARQTQLPVSLIPIEVVRAGVEVLHAALEALDGVAIVDALDDGDLRIIGSAARSLRLITGGSGVALGLPDNFRSAVQQMPVPAEARPRGRAVVLAGSCSTATRRQIQTALAAGMPGLKLDPLALARGEMSIDDAAAFACRSPSDLVPLIYASDAPEAVAESQRALGRERAGAVVENFFAELAAVLVASGFHRLLVAGGETSGAVIEKLGVKALDVGPEIDAGVPWMHAVIGGDPVALALKSGNFGADDIFLEAWGKFE